MSDPCASCRKPLTPIRFATRDGFICSRCEGKQRKAYRRKNRRKRTKP